VHFQKGDNLNNMKQTNITPDQSTILVVDDDRTTLMVLETRLKQQGYKVLTAVDGKSACEVIKKMHEVIDAILLDRMMPGMDGIEVVKWLHQQKHITKPPVIMQTGADNLKQIQEGIEAGVFYYLTKPIDENILKSVVISAVRESKQHRILSIELQRHRISFKLMDRCVFHFRTITEAENIACFVANCFPEPSNVLSAIAELTINAVEHGLLAVSYDDKTQLIKSGTWLEELERRGNLPETINKKVELIFSREESKTIIKISDPGKGFNWIKYLNVDPARAMDNHGRGIARANMIFSDLQYNKEGNQLLATMDESVKATLDW